MSRVVLAMSGGVDSSVAAHLLVRDGYEVIGVFMRHGQTVVDSCDGRSPLPVEGLDAGDSTASTANVVSSGTAEHGCCTVQDAYDAQRVADQFDIPFYVLNFEVEFARIIDYFVDQYASGRTPNPCIVCNNWLKFGRLFDYADTVGADFVATGHYARRVTTADQSEVLCRGLDRSKDQSYVLFGIDRARLKRMLLPVGNYHKSDIRDIAAKAKLRVAAKRDSQEICFVPKGYHGEFVRGRLGKIGRAGRIVTTDGRVVGRHDGIESYTIGQRKGLGVAMGEPFFVVRIDAETRDVVIGRREELARIALTANGVNWLTDPVPRFRCRAQIRYNSPAVAATVEFEDNTLRVEFDEPCYGVAPGQAVVCYGDDRVLAGGWIL